MNQDSSQSNDATMIEKNPGKHIIIRRYKTASHEYIKKYCTFFFAFSYRQGTKQSRNTERFDGH